MCVIISINNNCKIIYLKSYKLKKINFELKKMLQ